MPSVVAADSVTQPMPWSTSSSVERTETFSPVSAFAYSRSVPPTRGSSTRAESPASVSSARVDSSRK